MLPIWLRQVNANATLGCGGVKSQLVRLYVQIQLGCDADGVSILTDPRQPAARVVRVHRLNELQARGCAPGRCVLPTLPRLGNTVDESWVLRCRDLVWLYVQILGGWRIMDRTSACELFPTNLAHGS